MSDQRDKRLAYLRDGHICTLWWQGCTLCAARLAEMEKLYPKDEAEAERK